MDRRSFDVALVDRAIDLYGLDPNQFRVYLCLVLSPEIERDAIAPRCLMEYSEVDEALAFLDSRKLISVGGKNIRLNPAKAWLPCEAPPPVPAKPKKARITAETLKPYLDDWNATSPNHWVKHTALDSGMFSALVKLINEHGDNAPGIFHDGLLYARQNTWCLEPTHRLTMKKYLSKEKPFDWAEDYRSRQVQRAAAVMPEGKALPLHPTAPKEEMSLEIKAKLLNTRIERFPHLKQKAIEEGQSLGLKLVNGLFKWEAV